MHVCNLTVFGPIARMQFHSSCMHVYTLHQCKPLGPLVQGSHHSPCAHSLIIVLQASGLRIILLIKKHTPLYPKLCSDCLHKNKSRQLH